MPPLFPSLPLLSKSSIEQMGGKTLYPLHLWPFSLASFLGNCQLTLHLHCPVWVRPKPIDLLYFQGELSEIERGLQLDHEPLAFGAVVLPAIFYHELLLQGGPHRGGSRGIPLIAFGMEEAVLIVLLGDPKVVEELLDGYLGPIPWISSQLLGHILGEELGPELRPLREGPHPPTL